MCVLRAPAGTRRNEGSCLTLHVAASLHGRKRGIKGEQTKARRKIRRKENSSKAFFMSRLPFANALRVKSRDPQGNSGPATGDSGRNKMPRWRPRRYIKTSESMTLVEAGQRWSGRSMLRPYGILLRQNDWVKKAGAPGASKPRLGENSAERTFRRRRFFLSRVHPRPTRLPRARYE